MIEVEVKFHFDDATQEKVLDGAEQIFDKTIHDIYYDDQNLSLATKDNWLRNRNGKFELKTSADSEFNLNKRAFELYDEVDDEPDIRKFLQLGEEKDLAKVLAKKGYKKFVEFTTRRRKYKKEGFIIDIDEADFDFKVAEIELMVESESEVSAAREKIAEFAKKFGLTAKPVHGKVLEYLKRHQPKNYDILKKAGRL